MGQAPAWKEGEGYQELRARPLARGLGVRPADLDRDVEELVALAIRSHRLVHPEEPDEAVAAGVRASMEEAVSRRALIVAEDTESHRVAGYLLVRPDGTYQVGEGPAYRRRGVATLLVDAWNDRPEDESG